METTPIMVKTSVTDTFKKVVVKNRYLIIYIFFGALSLLIEISLRIFLNQLLNFEYINIYAVIFGILFSAYANLKFNFNVPRKKYLRSVTYFFIVSISSYLSQLFLVDQIPNLLPENEYLTRILVSGIFFIFFYFVHLNFTFSKTVKIGYAVHPKSDMNLGKDENTAIDYSDFTHIDLIDESYNIDNICNDIILINSLISKLKTKKIQIHIMSKNPGQYLNQIPLEYVDVFIHYEDLASVAEEIYIGKNNIGVVLNDPKIDISELKTIVNKFKKIMILCIDKPGFSGQKFNEEYFELLDKLYQIKLQDTEITVDGGINDLNVKNFSVEKIVSQSFLSYGNNPIEKIINLKDSNKYG